MSLPLCSVSSLPNRSHCIQALRVPFVHVKRRVRALFPLMYAQYSCIVTLAAALRIIRLWREKFYHNTLQSVKLDISGRNALFCLSNATAAFLDVRLNFLIAANMPPTSVWKSCVNDFIAFMSGRSLDVFRCFLCLQHLLLLRQIPACFLYQRAILQKLSLVVFFGIVAVGGLQHFNVDYGCLNSVGVRISIRSGLMITAQHAPITRCHQSDFFIASSR